MQDKPLVENDVWDLLKNNYKNIDIADIINQYIKSNYSLSETINLLNATVNN